jgi:hypothetical protein
MCHDWGRVGQVADVPLAHRTIEHLSILIRLRTAQRDGEGAKAPQVLQERHKGRYVDPSYSPP